ncbi:hypothetical protein UlMin_034178 [Ulmus minor]
MATYLPNLSNKKGDLLTPYDADEKFDSCPQPLYMNQTSTTGSYSMILPGSSLSSNCVDSVQERNEMMFIPPISDPVENSLFGDSSVLSRNQSGHYQGLSLSLSTEIPPAVSSPSFQYQYPNSSFSWNLSTSLPIIGNEGISCKGDESFYNSIKAEGSGNSLSSANMNKQYRYDQSGFCYNILSNRYLKAAQRLLDEVVNVGEALKQLGLSKNQYSQIGSDNCFKEIDGKSNDPSESSRNSGSELSSAERQDLQNKKTKLTSLLEEIDRRYRQYHHQMQVVVSFLDNVAGRGAAEPYTALARKTISRHFRCLRDAITGQIQVIQRSLGEQDTTGNGQGGVIPRLRYVDLKLRQQRAVNPLGVMRHAWRPQRGLPESSVSILRAWLFEHFLHPYPKESEKLILAKQTGLTPKQVANWFINARVRLWKPMVEEMYKEEFSDSEMNSKLSPENAAKLSSSEDKREEDQFLDNNFQTSLHQDNNLTNSDQIMITKLQGEQKLNMEEHGAYLNESVRTNQNDDRRSLMSNSAGTYDISELGNILVRNQVSLALELRHCESDGFGSHLRGNDSVVAAASLDYHGVEPEEQQQQQQQQSRFSNPHLLHDFVV